MSLAAAGAVLDRTAPAAPPRVLLAPVTVSPTKPLTPTHLKYLLSLDLLRRATATFAEVTFVYRHASYAGSRQVAGFWDHLERSRPGARYGAMSEEEIGELYCGYHRADRVPYAELAPMVRRAEAGWVHPASARLLDLWEGHYRLLGLADPGLGRSGPSPAPPEEIIGLLADRELAVDARQLGAPVYLDATAAGLPLRAVLSPDGQPNYLLYLLRELVPLLPDHDVVVLAHDTQLRTDYQIVAHVLTALGARVVRYEVPRVPIGGSVLSSRFGGWQGTTLGAFAGEFTAEFGVDAFRLGLRLYLVAGLGPTARQSFSLDHLRRWTLRARRLLDRHPVPAPADPVVREAAGLLAAGSGRRGYADPYGFAARLMSREPAAPVAGLLGIALGAPPPLLVGTSAPEPTAGGGDRHAGPRR